MAQTASKASVKHYRSLYVEVDAELVKQFNDKRGSLTQSQFMAQVLQFALPQVEAVESAHVKFKEANSVK